MPYGSRRRKRTGARKSRKKSYRKRKSVRFAKRSRKKGVLSRKRSYRRGLNKTERKQARAIAKDVVADVVKVMRFDLDVYPEMDAYDDNMLVLARDAVSNDGMAIFDITPEFHKMPIEATDGQNVDHNVDVTPDGVMGDHTLFKGWILRGVIAPPSIIEPERYLFSSTYKLRWKLLAVKRRSELDKAFSPTNNTQGSPQYVYPQTHAAMLMLRDQKPWRNFMELGTDQSDAQKLMRANLRGDYKILKSGTFTCKYKSAKDIIHNGAATVTAAGVYPPQKIVKWHIPFDRKIQLDEVSKWVDMQGARQSLEVYTNPIYKYIIVFDWADKFSTLKNELNAHDIVPLAAQQCSTYMRTPQILLNTIAFHQPS